MALLQSASGQLAVPCRSLVGRSTLADVVLTSRRASNEHASIGWYSNHWVLRDLGSSNGTTVDGRLLSPRDRIVLAPGNVLQFGGDAESLRVLDVAPPAPCAVLLGPQTCVWGQRALLVLPSEAAPEASVFFADGSWQIDDGASTHAPECGDIVALPTGHWRLLLPDDPDADGFTAGHQLELNKLELVFRVSSDAVVLNVVQGSADIRLPARACVQTLYCLAQLRQAPNSQNNGWVGTAELAEMRSCSPEKINVDVHRLRKLFEEAGVHDAARIVERDDTKKLRIGVERLRKVLL
ncbi:MAG TPA: FHA domain-containing protein [Polyangiaceae bacterium]